jgi:hypothetical protein
VQRALRGLVGTAPARRPSPARRRESRRAVRRERRTR